jgi:hypothetical protein
LELISVPSSEMPANSPRVCAKATISARRAAVVAPPIPAPMVATATEASAPNLNWLSSNARRPRSVSTTKMNSASWMPIWKPMLPLPMA